MFDDLIDPDPPRPGLDTLANVSERARRLRRRREATRVMSLGAVAGLLVGSLAFVVDGDPDRTTDISESLDDGEDVVVDLDELVNPTTLPEPATANTAPSTAATAPSDSSPTDQTTTTPAAANPATTTTTMALPTEPVPFLAVGDSVMLGAAPALSQRGLVIDAAVSRQMIDMVPVFEQFRDLGLFGAVVVVHLGTNGSFSQATLDAFLATLDGVPNVILMTVRADRGWTAENNALLRAADLEGDNKILIDWETLSSQCPGECFYEDGIHLRPVGQQYYANLIADVIGL
ncbi:MAG TPA: hypothetical protein VNO51_15855 [Ilumatobacteraceae bacterium]|nr:hypothetical protein [Ilumatobacteraceae bacterium]